MKIAFLHSDKPRERLLSDAVLRGAAKRGHVTEAFPLGQPPEPGQFDVVCMVGVKSRDLFHAHHRAGSHVLYADKGYCRSKGPGPVRGWEYWRVSIDTHHPTDRLMEREYDDIRWRRLGLEIMPWRTVGSHVVIAGSSQKYHDFYGLKNPTTYARDLVRDLRGLTERPLVYRPKPSWRDAVEIRKTRFSGGTESIHDALTDAWALVTHGSNACFEAVISGVPSIVLGNGVARPLSSTSVAEIERPRLASDEERHRWAHALAFWQWTLAEFASGEAWEFLEGEIHR